MSRVLKNMHATRGTARMTSFTSEVGSREATRLKGVAKEFPAYKTVDKYENTDTVADKADLKVRQVTASSIEA